jgi:hypothetical protein
MKMVDNYEDEFYDDEIFDGIEDSPKHTNAMNNVGLDDDSIFDLYDDIPNIITHEIKSKERSDMESAHVAPAPASALAPPASEVYSGLNSLLIDNDSAISGGVSMNNNYTDELKGVTASESGIILGNEVVEVVPLEGMTLTSPVVVPLEQLTQLKQKIRESSNLPVHESSTSPLLSESTPKSIEESISVAIINLAQQQQHHHHQHKQTHDIGPKAKIVSSAQSHQGKKVEQLVLQPRKASVAGPVPIPIPPTDPKPSKHRGAYQKATSSSTTANHHQINHSDQVRQQQQQPHSNRAQQAPPQPLESNRKASVLSKQPVVQHGPIPGKRMSTNNSDITNAETPNCAAVAQPNTAPRDLDRQSNPHSEAALDECEPIQKQVVPKRVVPLTVDGSVDDSHDVRTDILFPKPADSQDSRTESQNELDGKYVSSSELSPVKLVSSNELQDGEQGRQPVARRKKAHPRPPPQQRGNHKTRAQIWGANPKYRYDEASGLFSTFETEAQW